MEHGSPDARCDWCGRPLRLDEGFRAAEEAGERVAAFCRLEHVVPWAIQGPHWRAGALPDKPDGNAGLSECAECGVVLDDTRVLLVRHRGEHRVGDAFCGVDHLRRWAQAGGRWR